MKNDSRTELKSGYILFIIFIVFSLGIITTGFLYYKNYEKKYRTELEQQLSAVTELKMSQFFQWRRESLFAMEGAFREKAKLVKVKFSIFH